MAESNREIERVGGEGARTKCVEEERVSREKRVRKGAGRESMSMRRKESKQEEIRKINGETERKRGRKGLKG